MKTPCVRDVLAALDRIAPANFAFEFDRVGLQVGDPNAPIGSVLVSLDRSLAAIDAAIDHGCQMLISHHPLIFAPLNAVCATSHTGKSVLRLAAHGIAFAAAHTNWDCALGGVNDELATIFGLVNIQSFGTAADIPNPQPAGRVGSLTSAMTFEAFATSVSLLLDTKVEAWGNPERPVRRLAIVGGAADGEWMNAQRAKADVLLTGEVKQHIAVEASESGMSIIAAGHYATEQPGARALCARLQAELPDIQFVCFEPCLGLGGRPFSR